MKHPYQCKANRTADPPQDCDAPWCGCNPAWTQCIEWLQEAGWSNEVMTREQFDAQALALAHSQPLPTLITLLTDPRIGYDRMPPHLKRELHSRLGVEPVQMFRKVKR